MTASETSLVPCPACQAELPIPTQQLGQKVRCGKCQQVFQTPAAPKVSAPTPKPEPQEFDNPFAIPSSAADREDDSDDDLEPAPRRKEKARSTETKKGIGAALIIGGSLFGLVLVAGAAAGIIYAMKETPKTAEATKPKETPPPKPKEKEKAKPPELAVGPDGKMLDAVREKVKGSTVYIRTLLPGGRAASGSGFIAAGPGLIVTNSHVIGQTQTKIEAIEGVEVVVNSGLPDAKTYKASILKADRGLDLALLKIDLPAGPPPLEVIDSYKLKETQEIYIFGFPRGEQLGTNISVNISTISSLRREEGITGITPWIQVAGGMTNGNSGGPVTDVYGRVIGVARAGIKDTQINMAIPGDIVHAFFNNAGDLIPKKQ